VVVDVDGDVNEIASREIVAVAVNAHDHVNVHAHAHVHARRALRRREVISCADSRWTPKFIPPHR